MKRFCFLLFSLVSMLSLGGCSNAAQNVNPNNIVYYNVRDEYTYDDSGEHVKKSIVVFDIDKEGEFPNTLGDDASYAGALSVRNDYLFSFTLSGSYNSDNVYVYKRSVPVYVFGDEIIPESKNDGDGTVLNRNMYSIHFDSGRMVIQSPSNVTKLVTTLLVTESYAKSHNIEIKKL